MRVLYISLAVIFTDQLTKLLVKGFSIPFLGIDHPGMDYAQSIHIFGEWFNITFIENPNMAFSLDLAGKTFLSIFAIVASVFIIVYLYRHRESPLLMRLALALILAGAVGNLIDRTLYGVLYGTASLFEGHVVDFIDFDLFTVNFGDTSFRFWPIFNVADMSVSFGVVMLLLASRKSHAEEQVTGADGSDEKEENPSEPLQHSDMREDAPVR